MRRKWMFALISDWWNSKKMKYLWIDMVHEWKAFLKVDGFILGTIDTHSHFAWNEPAI